MDRGFAVAGSLSAFVAVLAGAFGAHALRQRLPSDLLAVFDWLRDPAAMIEKPYAVLGVKHHLALLRAAGLVTLTEEGGLSYYSLRRERLDDASSELKRYLA